MVRYVTLPPKDGMYVKFARVRGHVSMVQYRPGSSAICASDIAVQLERCISERGQQLEGKKFEIAQML